MKKADIKTDHARLSPSNLRWPNCPGSIREEAQYPNISSEAAIDGIGSHLLLERCITSGKSAIEFDQQIIGENHPENPNGWLIDLDRIMRVQMALDYIARQVRELKAVYHTCQISINTEFVVNPGGMFLRNDWWGTCDILIKAIEPHTGEVSFIEVCDYKDGSMYVDVRDNTQLISYLAGAMRPYVGSGSELVQPFRKDRVKNCRMTIIQPKTTPVVRYQCSTRPEDNISVEQILDKAIELNKAAALTDMPDAPARAGKWCQWCKANPKRGGHCTAKSDNLPDKVTFKRLMQSLEQLSIDPKSVLENELAELLNARKYLMKLLEVINEEAETRVIKGQKIPGYILSSGRKNYSWNADEEIIVKKLKAKRLKRDDYYPKKLASPSMILNNVLLSDEQKKRIKKELVEITYGDNKLKQVEVEEPTVPLNEMFLKATVSFL